MATRTIGTKIKMEGEREYKDAISNINANLATMSSEMRKVTAEYQDNANSVEALTAKGDVLKRTLDTQQEKVEELRKALQASVEAYGEADKETQKWQKQLNDAEAAVYNTEHAIRENNEALEEASNQGQQTGMTIADLAEKFGIKLPDGLQKATSDLGTFSAKTVAVMGAVTAAVAAAIKGYEKLIGLTREMAAQADETLTLAQVTGLDTDTIQQMEYAAEFVDVSFETIKGSLTKLKNNMQDAAAGNENLAESFMRLGVAVEDSNGLRNAEDVFYDLIDALGNIENQTERDTVAMDLFGKKAEDLNPLINAGSKALKEYGKEAENMGVVLDKSALAKLGAVDDAYQKLQKTQEGIKKQIAAEMAPVVADFYENWQKLMEGAGKVLIDSGIIEGLGDILGLVSDLLSPLTWIFNTAIPAIKEGLEKLSGAMYELKTNWIVSEILDLFNTLRFLTSSPIGQYFMLKDAGNGKEMRPINEWYNAPGNMNFAGGMTWVGENGPELVSLPAGSSIANAQESRELGGDTFYITIDASSVQEFNDIVELARNARINSRMRG